MKNKKTESQQASQVYINQERLEEVCKILCDAAAARQYIFRDGFKRFIPQWNIPKELEFNPQSSRVKEPLQAAQFLWTEVSMERINVSRTLMKNCLRTWYSSDRWIFFPEQVATHLTSEIERVFKECFKYNLISEHENPPYIRYRNNSHVLIQKFGSDPRKLVENLTVEESKKLMSESFEGIGSGLSSLYALYLTDREIARVKDPESLPLKVDIHKSRIPVNTDCLTINNHRVHRGSLVPIMEAAYLNAIKNKHFSVPLLDSALWIIGSEVCAKRNYRLCKENCPLAGKFCNGSADADRHYGGLIVNNEYGKRIDNRKHKNQGFFDFISEP